MNQLARVETEIVPGRCILRIHGEVDISNADEVSEAIDQAVSNEGTTVVLDLTPTTYLDSSGIQLLVQLAERLGDRRHALRVVVPRDSALRTLIELTGLEQVIPIRSSMEDASSE
jgi:anti-anti-sigma factor